MKKIMTTLLSFLLCLSIGMEKGHEIDADGPESNPVVVELTIEGGLAVGDVLRNVEGEPYVGSSPLNYSVKINNEPVNNVKLSWIALGNETDQYAIIDFSGDIDYNKNCHLKVTYVTDANSQLNAGNLILKVNGGNGIGFWDTKCFDTNSDGTDDFKEITCTYQASKLLPKLPAPYTVLQDSNNGSITIVPNDTSDTKLNVFSTAATVGKPLEQCDWPNIFNSIQYFVRFIGEEYGNEVCNFDPSDASPVYNIVYSNSDHSITIPGDWVNHNLLSGNHQYSIILFVEGEQIELENLSLKGAEHDGPGNFTPPSSNEISVHFEAFQNDIGEIIIAPKEGVESSTIPSLNEYISNILIIGNDYRGEQFGTSVDDNNELGININSKRYDSSKKAIVISSDWAITKMIEGNYYIYLRNGNNSEIIVGPLHIRDAMFTRNHNENVQYKYGFFYPTDNDGLKLFTTGYGDDEFRTSIYTTEEYYLAIGSYNNGNNTFTSDGIPENAEYKKVHPISSKTRIIASPDLEGKISFSNFEEAKLNGRDAFKLSVTVEPNVAGTFYLIACFTVDGVKGEQYAYKKFKVKPAQTVIYDIDISGDSTNALNKINSIFASLESLKAKFNNLKPATEVEDQTTYVFNFVNGNTGDCGDIVLDGDITWNVSWPIINDQPRMDHNTYVIEGNGVTIKQSLKNTGRTGIVISNLFFEADDDYKATNNPAIDADKGDINISECYVENYAYGVKTHKKADSDVSSGFVGYIYATDFVDCGTAIHFDNNVNTNGVEFNCKYEGNYFVDCGTAVEIVDLISNIQSVAVEFTDNYFLACDKDFDISHSSHQVDTEYYYFLDNYFSSVTNNIAHGLYRSAIINCPDSVVVCTSPAKMFPDNKNNWLGIDNEAITILESNKNYNINVNSKFKSATILNMNPQTGIPYGTSVLGGLK